MSKQITGDTRLLAEIERMKDRIREGSTDGLINGMSAIVKRSSDNAPVDSGTLRDDTYMSPVSVSEGSARIEGGHGARGSMEYAPTVHELPTTRSGRPKFLQHAVNEAEEEVMQAIADAVWGSISRSLK